MQGDVGGESTKHSYMASKNPTGVRSKSPSFFSVPSVGSVRDWCGVVNEPSIPALTKVPHVLWQFGRSDSRLSFVW